MTLKSFDRISEILVKHSTVDSASLAPETQLETLGIDSFDFIEFVFLVEEEFGIRIDMNFNDVGSRLKTVGDVAAAVDGLVAAKAVSMRAGESGVPA